jgi:phage pi2 protein 07
MEVNDKPCKEHFQKMKKEADQTTKKMLLLNPKFERDLPIMVVIFYDASKGKTYHDAKTYSEFIKSECKIEQNLICKV